MNQTLNGSGAEAPAPSDSEVETLGVASWVLSALVMFTCACGMAGNGLVVWLLAFRVQRTPCSVYILHLAVADFFFLLCMASLLALEIGPLANQHPVAYRVLRTLKYFFYTTGLSLLTAISTQRCLSVLFPVWYKCHQPRHLSAGVCAGLWALSLVLNTLAFFFCSMFWHWDEKHCFTVDSVISALIMGLFTPVLAVSSMTLFVRVRRGLRRRRPTRLYVVILASVLVYLTCALPLGVSWFLLSWLSLQQWVEVLYHGLSRLTSSVSSSANPVIYFLVGHRRDRGLRESLGAMLRRALRDTPELEGRETLST